MRRATTYIRFAIDQLDRYSTRPQGVFAAAYALLNSGILHAHDEKQLRAILNWFGRNLPVPQNFRTNRAIFWFKSDAKDCTRKIWQLVLALRYHHRQVNLLRTQRPGYVLYEDEFQVGAIPFYDTL
jgi:hypothetical protein